MARNRVIHNVQDVFVGSTPDEADHLITGIDGHQVLKRLNRVQSFNYSIDTPQQDSLTLGKSKPFSRESNDPPTVNLSLSYLLNGVDNERRIGLNVGSIEDTPYASDFNAGKDGWTGSSLSHFDNHVGGVDTDQYATGNGPPADGGKGHLHIRCDTGASSHYIQRSIFTVGKKYKVTGRVWVNSTNPALTSVRIHDGYGVALGNITDRGQWVPFDIEFIAVSEKLVFYGMNSTPDYTWASAGTTPYDDFFVADIAATEVKCLTHDLLTSRTKDARNIYLTINDDDIDVRKSNPWLLSTGVGLTEANAGDPDATNYGTVVFQNCYLTQYSLKVEPSALPQVDLNYTADNIIAHVSGSGIDIQTLDAQDGSVTNSSVQFIIPKHFLNDPQRYTNNFTKDYSHTNVTISSQGVNGVNEFLDDHITSCSLDTSIDREAMAYVGHKLISDRIPKIPMSAELSFDTVVKENISGSFLDNMNENEDYNVIVDLQDKSNTSLAKYTFSGAKLENVSYESEINSNRTASLAFSTYMDLENQTEGLFTEGKITSAGNNIYTSDFSVDSDGFQGNSYSSASSPNTVGGLNNVCKANMLSSFLVSHEIARPNTFTVGKKYKISGKFYVSAGNRLQGMSIYLGSQTSYPGQKFHITPNSTYLAMDLETWVDFDFEVVASHVNLYFYPLGSDRTENVVTATSDYFAIKDIVVTNKTDLIYPQF